MTAPLTQFTRLIDEAFNTGDLAVLEDLVSPHFVEHQFESPQRPARVTGPAGVARIISELRAGADDFHLAIEDVSVAGDTLWARLRGTGTDTGGQLGQPPTGKPFAIAVIDIARFLDGRMVEHWGVPDRLGLLLQLGLFDGAQRDAPARRPPQPHRESPIARAASDEQGESSVPDPDFRKHPESHWRLSRAPVRADPIDYST